MPMCTNVNAAFAEEIIENNTGSVFDHIIKSMINAMTKSLVNYELYHSNMKEFAETHSIHNYLKKIIDIIFKYNL